MDLIEFYRHEQQRLHEGIREVLANLSVEEWNKVPGGTCNNLTFLVWHCVRTEDNILRFILQGRPTIWHEGNWHERLGLPLRAQGTGMQTEEAQSLHIDEPALFMNYAEEVWQEYKRYLEGITDGGAALSERRVTVKPLGEVPAILTIGQICLSHLYTHLGEMILLKGLLGKKGWSL